MVTFGSPLMISRVRKFSFYQRRIGCSLIFCGNLPFPLTDGFSLGPMDDSQAISNIGKIDDFRIYGISLSSEEISKLYGAGNGDFNEKEYSVLLF